jgi:hypothetical protein
MIQTINIEISHQARMMLEKMPDVDANNFLNWFCKVRKISAGGGDLINYLEYLKTKEGRKND